MIDFALRLRVGKVFGDDFFNGEVSQVDTYSQ